MHARFRILLLLFALRAFAATFAYEASHRLPKLSRALSRDITVRARRLRREDRLRRELLFG